MKRSRARHLMSAAVLLAAATTLSALEPVDLSGDWKFRLDPADTGRAEGWHTADHDDSEWGALAVPGDWGDGVDGVGWYRTTVRLGAEWAGAPNTKLLFKQSDDWTEVYVDGRLLATNSSWSSPFVANLDELVADMTGPREFTLAVRVTDFGGPGGLLQPVSVLSVEDVRELYRTEWYDRKPHRTLNELGDMVMYSVYVRNQTPEGTFKAFERELPGLRAMGVNVLWLLPIHEIGVVERKGVDGSPYAIKDYYSVDPALGTKEDFRSLVEAAHANGMLLIIDLVMNHMSHDSVMALSRPDMFLRDESGKPMPAHPEWADVVDWDWDNREVHDYNLDLMEYWVREFDIDGYRADVADLMPDDFWQEARRRLDAVKPGCLLLAESTNPRQHLNGFDLTYGEGLRDAAIGTFANGQPASTLKTSLLTREYSLPRGAVDMQFVENHDKTRAIHEYGGPEQMKLGAVLTATLPGIPLLYSGTEVAADADRDETFFRKTAVEMHRDPHGMRAFWNGLLALRARHPALRRGELAVLDAEPAATAFAFERALEDNRVLVILNAAGETSTITLDHPLLPGGEVELGPRAWTIFAE